MSGGIFQRLPLLPSLRLVDAAGVGACALMLGAAYLMGLAPRLHERASAAERRSDLDTARAELAALSESKRGREARADELEKQLRAGSLRLSSAQKINARVDQIVDLAGSTGVRISEVTPGSPVLRDRLTVVPIRVRGFGGYAQVTEMLSRMHEVCPETAVASLSLSGTVTGEVPPEFSVEFAWHTAPDGTVGAVAAHSPK